MEFWDGLASRSVGGYHVELILYPYKYVLYKSMKELISLEAIYSYTYYLIPNIKYLGTKPNAHEVLSIPTQAC